MKKTKSLQILNSFDLKLLAIIFMLCDHIWATLITGNQWLTDIGRMAFPIFAFQIAEGFFHTKNFKKYLGRMFLFALISEVPFNLMYSGRTFFPFHQNVMFTFCLALLFIRFMEWGKKKNIFVWFVTIAISCICDYMLGMISMVDYFGYGILTVFLFYIFHDFKFAWLGQLIGMIIINGYMMAGLTYPINIFGFSFDFPQQAFAVFALIPIWLYNGKQGPHSKPIQYSYYAFYPVHMIIIHIIRKFIVL